MHMLSWSDVAPSDPQNTRTDAELIEALKRAWLLPREGPVDGSAEAKFSLDAPVSDEGGSWPVCVPDGADNAVCDRLEL